MKMQKVTIELQKAGKASICGSIKREGGKFGFISFTLLSNTFTAAGYNYNSGVIVHDYDSSETFDDFVKAVFSA